MRRQRLVLRGRRGGAQWAGGGRGRPVPDVVAIQELDHLCTPVYNQIIDNTYKDCGAFIDQTWGDPRHVARRGKRKRR